MFSHFSQATEASRVTDKLLSTAQTLIERMNISKMQTIGDVQLGGIRIIGHFFANLAVELSEVILKKMKPVVGKRLPSKVGFVWASSDYCATFILMSFSVTFFHVYTLTTFIAKRARPKDCTEVIERFITVIQISFL
jgi:hypothetical protein